MRSLHALRRRSLAPAIGVLVLLAVAVLGGCSVAGGVTGSISQSGARVGATVDFSIIDVATWSRAKQPYEVETVYVVPDHNASP